MKPRPYQEEAIQLGLIRSALIADEPGLGKTLEGIEIARRRMIDLGGPTLIVVPKRTREQWITEIYKQDPDNEVVVIESYTPIVPQWHTYYIMHYEVAYKLGSHLQQFTWTTMILDEAHRIKNRRARVTEILKKFRALRKIALTGTPIEKSPADLWSILNWLYPAHFTSYWKWCDRYVHYMEFHRGKEVYRKIVGGARLDEMAEVLSMFAIQRTKAMVAPDLPPRIEHTVPVSMDDRQLKLYSSLAKSNDIEFQYEGKEIVIPSVLTQITRLQQVSTWPALAGFPEVPACKIEWLHEWLEDNPNETVVVFSRFRKTAEMLHSTYKDSSLVVGGSDWTQLKAFQEGDSHVLFGTIAAMAEGLNLQQARTAIFLDFEWSSIKMTQAVDRIHRINITEPKHIVYLCSSAIDDLIYNAFKHKWSEAQLVQEFLTWRSNG